MEKSPETTHRRILRQRASLLKKLDDMLEGPMVTLSLGWLAITIIELVRGNTRFLTLLSALIWVVFVLDYGVKLAVAPDRRRFILSNWVIGISLLVPAFRLFRILRVLSLLNAGVSPAGVTLARVLVSTNRGIGALRRSVKRRGLGYLLALTVLVTMAGAAGILSFEKATGKIPNYGTALWWTAMMISTIGSDYFPKTPEGRLLCFILAIYGVAVFGYLTASVASFFVGTDVRKKGPDDTLKAKVDELTREVRALRGELAESRKPPAPEPPADKAA